MQKLNTQDASALMQKLNTEGASALMQKLNTEGASALMQKLNTQDASALMQKLNTQDASALMQKLSYSNELMYAYVPSNKVGNIVSAITTDSLWAASEKHSDVYKFAVDQNGFSRKTGGSVYRHWVVSICPANYGNKINSPYDGETFISRDGMVQIMDSTLVVKNSPGDNWHIVLFFPRKSWDK